MQLLLDPSFELGLTDPAGLLGWRYTGGAGRVQLIGGVLSGTWSGALPQIVQGSATPMIAQFVTVTPGTSIYLRANVKRFVAGRNLEFRAFNPDEAHPVLLGTLFDDTVSPGWHVLEGNVVAAGALMGWAVSAPTDSDPIGQWVTDDAQAMGPATEPVMREQIEANLFAKLQQIAPANGYENTAATVARGRVRKDALPSLPAIYLSMATARTDEIGAPYHEVRRSSYWLIRLYVNTETESPTDLLSLLRDVARAVETDQSCGGLGFVSAAGGRAVLIEDEDAFDVGQDFAKGVVGYSLLLRVTYLAPHGVI